MANDIATANNQLVRFFLSLHRFHTAEYGPQDAFEYYHIIQEESGRASGGVGPALPALGHALAGALATAGAKAFVYPIELCITRLQVQKQLRGKGEAESAARDAETEYASLLDAVQKIYKTEGGLKALYTGLTPDLGKGIADSFLFFLSYTFLRQYEKQKGHGASLSVSKELGVGVAAGAFAKFFTTPIQNIVTRQQTAALVAARDPTSSTTPGESDKLSMKDIALQIRSERGLAGFWRGYSESVILTLNPAITFAVDKLMKRLLPRAQRENPSGRTIFLVAALSKAIATTITYPAMLAKSRAQAVTPKASLGAEEEAEGAETGGPPEMLEKSSTLNATPRRRKAKSLLQRLFSMLSAQYAIYVSLRKIYRIEGLSGLYSGLEGEVLKGFLQHGLTMMMKENVHVGVIQSYYLLLKATRRWPEGLEKAQGEAGRVAADAQEKVVQAGEAVSEGARKMGEGVKGAVDSASGKE
ncbi:uncharacterized protein LTR77_005124 [Saxophila tyrrhenica]|uniref:Mitochondrial carrier n=1 Tax=Saxophila tyrrhenica TaxID=1690608 RepID=A0AAV9PBZ9_9PEZI|nr:hypothetical protein LTR77_005124 [Saxophila tyrrhenica]